MTKPIAQPQRSVKLFLEFRGEEEITILQAFRGRLNKAGKKLKPTILAWMNTTKDG